MLLEILTTCRATSVYSNARAACIFLLTRVAPTTFVEDEMVSNIHYEMTCWTDCMTPGAIKDFGRILEASLSSINTKVSFFRAWKDACLPWPMPQETSSGILVTAITSIGSDPNWSIELEDLVCQVAAKCLLFNHNPMTIAALLASLFSPKKPSVDKKNALRKALGNYASCLVEFESTEESQQSELLLQLVQACFAESSFHRKVIEWFDNDIAAQNPQELLGHMSRQDSIAAMSQLSHIVACTSSDIFRRRGLSLLRFLICVSLEVCLSKKRLRDRLRACLMHCCTSFFAIVQEPANSTERLVSKLTQRLSWCPGTELKGIELCSLVTGNQQSTCKVVSRLRSSLDSSFVPPRTKASEPLKLLSSQATREDIVVLMMVTTFLPTHVLDQALGALLRLWSGENTVETNHPFFIPAVNSCVQEMLARPKAQSLANKYVQTNVFQAWLSISDGFRQGRGSDHLALLCSSLEALLCRYLSCGSTSATLYLSTTEISSTDMIKRITATRLRQTTPAIPEACLMTHLFECDPYRFASAFVRLLVLSKNATVQNLWQAGAFDLPLSGVTRRRDIMDALGFEGKALVAAIMERSRTLIGKVVRSPVGSRSRNIPYAQLAFRSMSTKLEDPTISARVQPLQMLMTVRKQLIFDAAEKVSTSKQILALLQSSTCKNAWLKAMEGSTRLAFLEISVILRTVLDERQENQATLRCALGIALLHRLCDQLPRLLRKESKATSGKLSDDKTFASLHLIEWLSGLTKDSSNFGMDDQCMWSSSSIGLAVRACLKYGMAETDSQAFAATAAGCLRLVREILLCIHSAPPVLKANLALPSPEEVFELVVSHSQFHASMCEQSNSHPNEDRKLEAIRLLLTCISIATTPIELAKHVWDTFFAAHNAGVSVVDSTLRRLLYIASRQNQKVIFVHCKRFSAILSRLNGKQLLLLNFLE
jgi:hypothetical protein